jgi:hypothetical protein
MIFLAVAVACTVWAVVRFMKGLMGAKPIIDPIDPIGFRDEGVIKILYSPPRTSTADKASLKFFFDPIDPINP